MTLSEKAGTAKARAAQAALSVPEIRILVEVLVRQMLYAGRNGEVC